MRFAFLIITYSDVEQTKRLINRLNTGQFDFYIHLDKKIDIATHREIESMQNVYFIQNRIDINWAGYSTVKAALSGVRQIAATGIHYDFVNLITGQDYPIKSPEYIVDFLTRNVGKEFMYYENFENEWTEANKRVDQYHLTDFKFKGRHRLEKWINKVTPKRKFPGNLKLYGRETFWTLSLDCAKYVVDYIDTHPELNRFLQFTWGPDEFIFQTIIMNSHFAKNVVNNNYRYIVWPAGGARPNVLKTEDFDAMVASEDFLARKFDINVDPKVLDLLDQLK